MPRFNKDRYITEHSYEIPWRELHGNVNQEARVRNYLQAAEDQGIVKWDDHATVTDLDVSGQMGTYSDVAEEGPRGAARHILVEGISPQGEEIIFLKKISPGASSSHSYFYIDGKSVSAQKFIRRHSTILDPFSRMGLSEVSDKFIPGAGEDWARFMRITKPPLGNGG